MIIEFDWSNASFKTPLSAATPFQKASIQHQTIFWSYFPLKVGLFIMNIVTVFDFRVLDMTKIGTKIWKHFQAEKTKLEIKIRIIFLGVEKPQR